MIEKSLNDFLKRFNRHSPIIVAYSGGVDSQVLLSALVSLKHQSLLLNPITVCHVHHGLSENADKWQLFAKQQCHLLQIEFKTVNVNIKPLPQTSLEAQARDARYLALQAINKTPSLILTGHHSDDQTETFLLALKRGSGVKGLSAMEEISELGSHQLLRPLLKLKREEIERYAQNKNLAWVEDESNNDTRFDRNFIRKNVMPLLSERWPSISQTINRSATHCLEAQSLLNEMAEQDLDKCLAFLQNKEVLVEKTSLTFLEEAFFAQLPIEPLLALSSARFNNLFRYFLSLKGCLMPSSEQLIQVHQQLKAPQDKNPSIKVADYVIRRYKQSLYLTSDYQDISDWETVVQDSNKEQKIHFPEKFQCLFISLNKDNSGKRNLSYRYEGEVFNSRNLKAPQNGQVVSIRFAHHNPNCLPDYRQKSRSLKKILQELNIPSWQRSRIPYLYYDGELVAAIGLFVCKPYLVK
jgi:tRNA(Ile)-lysidine synthase